MTAGNCATFSETTELLTVPKLVRVEIRYYAQLREDLRLSNEEIELELPATEEDILNRLAQLHPKQAALFLASRAAVEDEYLPRGTVVQDLRAVDVIPPVSGG